MPVWLQAWPQFIPAIFDLNTFYLAPSSKQKQNFLQQLSLSHKASNNFNMKLKDNHRPPPPPPPPPSLIPTRPHSWFLLHLIPSYTHNQRMTRTRMQVQSPHASLSCINNISDLPRPSSFNVGGSGSDSQGWHSNTRRGKFVTIWKSSGHSSWQNTKK